MELSQQKAKDIDDILRFAVQHGLLESFDVSYYQKTARPDLDKSYLIHLAGLVNLYMTKNNRKWVGLDGGKAFTCNHNTKPFLESGGFQKIYDNERQQELKEQTDLELAQRMLKDYRLTKIIAWAGLIIAFGVAVIEFISFLKER